MLEKMQEYLKNMQQQAADAKSDDTVENMTDIVKEVADSLNQIHAIFVNTEQYARETADNVFDLTNKVAMLTNQAYSQRERCINALDSINRILSKKFDNDAGVKQQVQQTRILRKLLQKKEFETCKSQILSDVEAYKQAKLFYQTALPASKDFQRHC
jgi:5-bromo-4-chloroindolyl phosphate hydrolysis protein